MGIFNIDSGFSRFVSRAVDVLELNILWVIFSIPIFTIGASTCAAFSVTLKMVDEEEGYVGKMFVKAFKQNFKQGTIMWLITAPCIYLCYLIWQAIAKGDDVNFLIILGAILFTAIAICISLYTYPLLSRYENSIKNTIMNSIVICMLYFWRTLIMIAVVAVEVIIISWNKWTLLAGILIGPEFVIYTISGIAKKIFLETEKNGGVITPAAIMPQAESEPDVEESDDLEENDDAEEIDDTGEDLEEDDDTEKFDTENEFDGEDESCDVAEDSEKEVGGV